MLCEKVEWREGDLLALTGYIRGAAISADRLVHIPGLGDFQVGAAARVIIWYQLLCRLTES